MVMRPAVLGTKNDCAGEVQKQFTRPTDHKALTVTILGGGGQSIV
jgi:hypothetical protein